MLVETFVYAPMNYPSNPSRRHFLARTAAFSGTVLVASSLTKLHASPTPITMNTSASIPALPPGNPYVNPAQIDPHLRTQRLERFICRAWA
jgi:hypothetical protein